MIKRTLAAHILGAARDFPAIVLTGPRQSGKTTLLKMLPFKASYHLLEDPDELERVKSDPKAWLASCRTPAIVDEIQHAPELLAYIRSQIDSRRRPGQWFLTGSQDFSLMKGVTESLAGRAAIFHLLPFSLSEIYGRRRPLWSTAAKHLIRGFYPQPALGKAQAKIWFSSYLQTYIERDVRSITQVADLLAFRRFLQLCAARAGRLVNLTEIAAPLGVSVPTARRWLSILETTRQIILVPPYFSNFGKRLIKSPKLYFMDTGLLCYLLRLNSPAEVLNSPFAGFIFENFTLGELIKAQTHGGNRSEIYFFRDQGGVEIDFILPWKKQTFLIECKLTSTPLPRMAKAIETLLPKAASNGPAAGLVITAQGPDSVLGSGIRTQPLCNFLRERG